MAASHRQCARGSILPSASGNESGAFARGRRLALVVFLACAAVLPEAAAAAGFSGLGSLPGAVPGSAATAVSADGAVVVGSCPDGASCSEAWRWTQGTGIVGLGFLSGDATSEALAVSDDGSVVAGASGAKAARWVNGSGWQDLSGGLPAADDSRANGVSADGSAVVGEYMSPFMGAATGAFVWRQVGGTSLYLQDTVPILSSISGISSDGLVMSAWTGPYDAPWALRFTESGSQMLTQLSGVYCDCGDSAEAISADASTIVGQSLGQAFRWQSGTGTVGLGFLAPVESQTFNNVFSSGLAASADGRVVVGTSSELFCDPFPNCWEDERAFVWTQSRGMLDLRDELVALGLDLSGWTLVAATGVSADGSVIVGRGINPSGDPEAWRAEVPELAPPSIPALPAPALLLVLGAVMAAGYAGIRNLGFRRGLRL